MAKKLIKLAGRKWKRQFEEAAVAQSLAKTITEPVTNSYDSYKRLGSVSERATGMVDALLAVRSGSHLVHDTLVKELAQQTAKTIKIRLSRTSAGGLERKECHVVDFAEGMSAKEIDEKFSNYGAEKSGIGSGKGVRGLFGQGLCDVLFSHSPGVIRSIKDGIASECQFFWGEGDQPQYEVVERGQATKELRKDWGITENGTVIECQLSERCRIPHQDETVAARLANFYMLRLINSDPSTTVLLEQIRRDGPSESPLHFEFPRGQVLKQLRTEVKYLNYPPIVAEGIVVRADTPLPTKDQGDERLTGLLIVDEADTIYDQTFFSKYEGSIYLDQLYGVIRLTGIRDIIREKLNAGEALVTESRDGFDTSKDFFKALETALVPELEPIFKKEIERKSTTDTSLSENSEKKVKKALNKLNELFEEVTKESQGGGGGGGGGLKVPDTIAFEVDRVQLRLGQGRRIRLLGNPLVVKEGTAVLIDGDQSELRVEPTSAVWQRLPGKEQLLAVVVSIASDKLGLQGKVIALSQDISAQSLEAVVSVLDTVPPQIFEPPAEGLEFNPQIASAAPSRRGSISLLVNPSIVPVDTDILVSIHGDSAVRLVNESSGQDTISQSIKLTAEHLVPGTRVARIGIAFRGYGYGQKAKVKAACFVGKAEIDAEGHVLIQETKSPPGGVFKKVEYVDLPGAMSKTASEFEPSTGAIIVNRLHPINRAAFGASQDSFRSSVDQEDSAQRRLAEVIVDQCLFHTLAVAYQNSQITLPSEDVISSIRRRIEEFKFEYAEAVYREFVEGFSVPRIP